jgi:hypothetical protein
MQIQGAPLDAPAPAAETLLRPWLGAGPAAPAIEDLLHPRVPV